MATSRAGNVPRPLATAVACLAAFFGASSALAVAPNFTAIAPAGGQRGTSVEVTLRGDRLADAQDIFFYTPGITLEKISGAKDKEVKGSSSLPPTAASVNTPCASAPRAGFPRSASFMSARFPLWRKRSPITKPPKPSPSR